MASPKGQIFGDFRILFNDSSVISCRSLAIPPEASTEFDEERSFSYPILVPTINCIDSINIFGRIVLVVEKEAVFKNIVEDATYINHVFGPFVLVTGKGYPCLSTRNLVKMIEESHPAVPILGLFDCDPFGMDIFCTYKYGSKVISERRTVC